MVQIIKEVTPKLQKATKRLVDKFIKYVFSRDEYKNALIPHELLVAKLVKTMETSVLKEQPAILKFAVEYLKLRLDEI